MTHSTVVEITLLLASKNINTGFYRSRITFYHNCKNKRQETKKNMFNWSGSEACSLSGSLPSMCPGILDPKVIYRKCHLSVGYQKFHIEPGLFLRFAGHENCKPG